MGTNYFLRPADGSDALHIGKSSFGWCFSLHVMPERGIHDLDDWLPLFEAGEIRDEYGRTLSAQEMIGTITKRSADRGAAPFMPDWLASNHAEPGPNGLARHKVGPFCLKQGAGTWDCIEGDFG